MKAIIRCQGNYFIGTQNLYIEVRFLRIHFKRMNFMLRQLF